MMDTEASVAALGSRFGETVFLGVKITMIANMMMMMMVKGDKEKEVGGQKCENDDKSDIRHPNFHFSSTDPLFTSLCFSEISVVCLQLSHSHFLSFDYFF